MQVHEVCEIFPEMTDGEYRELLSDIARNGLREPIWLYEGKILDGRNRYRACRSIGIEPETRVYEGDDPVGLVVSLNLKRRHLSESQRAMVANRIANLPPGRPSKGKTPQICGVSKAQAASMLKVSPRSVADAHKVEEKASPNLKEAVNRGDVRVSAAALVADLSPAEQEATVAAGTVPEKAKEIRNGKSRVNGRLTDDPPNIAKLRENGRLAPEAVPEIEIADPDDTPILATACREPGEDDDADDEDWLGALPLSRKLSGEPYKTFCADALIYRRFLPTREAFRSPVADALGNRRQWGEFASTLKRLMKADNPRHWFLCLPMNEGGCGGLGKIAGFDSQCEICRGRGYTISQRAPR